MFQFTVVVHHEGMDVRAGTWRAELEKSHGRTAVAVGLLLVACSTSFLITPGVTYPHSRRGPPASVLTGQSDSRHFLSGGSSRLF